MERISWDQYFMAQSHLLSMRSTCTRLMVGATIVRDKRIIAGGYNGSVSGSVHCIDEGCYVVDGHCVRTVHAEANALIQCAKFGVPTEGAEIYITHFPCLQCTKLLIQSGIKAIYYASDYRNDEYAIQLLDEAQIIYKKIPLTDVSLDKKAKEKEHFVNQMISRIENLEQDSSEIEKIRKQAKKLFNQIR